MKQSIRQPFFWMVAAGTGGHIFPGLNLATALRELSPGSEFLFFGTRDRLEARIIPQAGYPIAFLKAGRWKGSGILSRVFGLFSIVAGFAQAIRYLIKRKPTCLISAGGYVSVPVALACRLFGIRFIILEPNIRAGMANRLLSKTAVAAFSAPGSDAKRVFACPVYELGNPVRKDLRELPVRNEVSRVLVLGGSQGALSLCRASLELAAKLGFAKLGLELVLQCGDKNVAQSQEWQREFGVESCTRVLPFIQDVPAALATADLVIARAGAMTISELSVAGLPTVFVPFPFAADNHQYVNAKMLADDGAALLVDEREEGFDQKLCEAVARLSVRPEQFELRQSLSERFLSWGRPEAARNIAQEILSMNGPKR